MNDSNQMTLTQKPIPDHETFTSLLRFIYSADIDSLTTNPNIAYHLLDSFKFFGLTSISFEMCCESTLLTNLAPENYSKYIRAAFSGEHVALFEAMVVKAK